MRCLFVLCAAAVTVAEMPAAAAAHVYTLLLRCEEAASLLRNGVVAVL